MKRLLIASALLAAAGVAGAGELLVTEAASGKNAGARTLALDVITDGNVSAMQFAIRFPGKVTSIDTSKCLADLPKTHTGLCKARADRGMVAVVLWNTENAALPAGAVAIGKVSANYGSGGSAGNEQAVEIQKLHMSGSDARAVASQVRNESGNDSLRSSTTER